MMGLSLFLLIVAVVFTWLVVRSVRAGYGKILLALGGLCSGLALLLSLQLEPGLARTILVNVLSLAVLCVPVLLLFSWFFRAPRSPR